MTSLFEPCKYENEEGDVYWQPTFPNGHRWYYDAEGRVITSSVANADRYGLTPAVVAAHHKAVKLSKREWARKIKEFNNG